MSRLPLRQAGVLVVLGALGACATNPATGKRELMLVSEGQEISLGRQEDEKVVASFGEYDDPALQELVATLGHSIAERSERPDLPWTFRLVDDAAVNAFALPQVRPGRRERGRHAGPALLGPSRLRSGGGGRGLSHAGPALRAVGGGSRAGLAVDPSRPR
jgi:hypothetical protein